MSYRLSAEESVRDGLLRILREEVEFAIARLRDPKKINRDKGIHEARKSVKKIRAIIRLCMPGLGDGGGRNDALLRDAGRGLSAYRDAATFIESIDGLEKRYGDEASHKCLDDVRAVLLRRREAAQTETVRRAALRGTIALLRRFGRELNAWPTLPDGFSAIAAGLKQTYRKGRKALALIVKSPSVENFHELRKSAKDHWYHVRLLESVWPGPMRARVKCLEDLQELLGDDHNLAVLRKNTEAAALMSLIGSRQEELRGAALALAERIYAERPRDHARLIGKFWKSWRPA